MRVAQKRGVSVKQCLALSVVAGAVALAGLAGASPGTTVRVSVDSSGAEADGNSFGPALNADGRYVAFLSIAGNLVPGDSNGFLDVFVHDRQTGVTTIESVNDSGFVGNHDSYDPKINADGRFVAFASLAGNLVPGDSNGTGDIFVRDRENGLITRVSVDANGVQGNGESTDPVISADGRFVAFTSFATNLVPGDTNGVQDIFLHDRETGQTSRVSVTSSGDQAIDTSHEPDISDDGNVVAFSSRAANLSAGDTNGTFDVFVHELQTGQTTRVSVTSSGGQGNDKSERPVLSSDGAVVAFDSEATNLATGDTNRVLDVFAHDRLTGATTRVSVRTTGAQGTKRSYNPDISGDGRLVSFNSQAKLDANDTNGKKGDVYVHDRLLAVTTVESVAASGRTGRGQSIRSSLTTDGRELGFSSLASDLVQGDTNGVRDIFVHALASSS
jgi:Tol biopolymer transport system component